MKKLFLALPILAGLTFNASAQQTIYTCGTDQNLQRQIAADPSILQRLMANDQAAKTLGMSHAKATNSAPFIIPVVFHVIHNGGSENISKAQILNQIATLNLDYMRLNADTTATRDFFKPVAGSVNVEFRLANIDPNGNCTDGIVRVKSLLTNEASDESGVKALSYWPSNKYLNIWVVNSIQGDPTQPGTMTLGYAQFPGGGSANTDGVVMNSAYVGSIGTASSNGNKGRTLTHEIGHILALYHTFQGGCDGGFFGEDIDDTPLTLEPNFGCNLNLNSCTNDSPNQLDMVENYMDYSNGSCQNMFSLGQISKMNGTLTGLRSQLVSASNNVATGTDDTIYNVCGPKAHFTMNKNFVCEGTQGGSIKFIDLSYNGFSDSRQWTFEGGTPATSTDSVVNVTYNTPGTYSVTLTVSNSLGTDTKTLTNYIQILNSAAFNSGQAVTEDFEEAATDYPITIDNVENLGGTWQTSTVGYNSSKALKIINYNAANPSQAIDNFILKPIDMTQLTFTKLTFMLSYAQRPSTFSNAASNEQLKVYTSTNCGQSWVQRYIKSGASLASTQQTNNGFAPSSASQWELHTVNLAGVASDNNLLIKFELTSSGGNNLYIDNINIGVITGIEEDIALHSNLTIAPNPASEIATISFSLNQTTQSSIILSDVLGREIKTILSQQLTAGRHSSEISFAELPNGIYILKLSANGFTTSQKLVVSK